MATLLLENLKLAMLYLFIASVIGLSHFDSETLGKMKRALKGLVGAR